MAKSKAHTTFATVPGAPPDLPVQEITLDGKTYKACFDFETLAESEAQLFLAGHQVNLFEVFPRTSLESVRILFAVALQRFHSDIPYSKRLKLLDGNLPACYRVVAELNRLWLGSMPAKEKDGAADPPGAGEPGAVSIAESAGSTSLPPDESSSDSRLRRSWQWLRCNLLHISVRRER